MKRLVARLYRLLPLPYWLQSWLIRRVAPTFLIGVAGVVPNERGEILLLEHVFRRHYAWGLPGGWLGRGESPAQALRRELREEVGLEIEVEALLSIELDENLRQLQIGYLCHAQGQPTHLSHEILSARWVAPDDLPDPLLPFHRALIARVMGQESG